MSPMRGSGLDQTTTVSLVIAQNKDSHDANASFCVPRQKVFRELDVSVLYPRVCSQHSADNRETSDTTFSGCSGGLMDNDFLFVDCNGGLMDNDFLFAGCNGGLMDKDLLFNRKPRSTQNAYVALQQFVGCDTPDSSCNGCLMDNDLLSSRNLDLQRMRRLSRIMQFADTTDSDFNGVSMDDAFLVHMKIRFAQKAAIHTKLLMARSKNTAPTVCRTWKSTMPCISVSLGPTARFGLSTRSPFVEWRFCGLSKRSPFVEWRICTMTSRLTIFVVEIALSIWSSL